MDGIGVQLAVGAFKAIALVYDILTFPVYLILQQPWRTRQLSRRPKVNLEIIRYLQSQLFQYF